MHCGPRSVAQQALLLLGWRLLGEIKMSPKKINVAGVADIDNTKAVQAVSLPKAPALTRTYL